MIRLHFLPNKFNPVKNTVSDYAVAPPGKRRSFAMIAMPLSGAASSLSLAAALAAGTGTASILAVLALVISSVCRTFLVFFPTDITGQPTTKIGRDYLVFAVATFAGVAFAADNFHLTVADGIIGQVVVWAALLLLVGFLPPFKKIFGLLERIFLLSSIIWLVTVGAELFLRG
jgi:hypothetical protein